MELLRANRRQTRNGLRKAAAVLALAGVGVAALSTRVTDIGHFVGLLASAGALVVGAIVLWVQASRTR